MKNVVRGNAILGNKKFKPSIQNKQMFTGCSSSGQKYDKYGGDDDSIIFHYVDMSLSSYEKLNNKI